MAESFQIPAMQTGRSTDWTGPLYRAGEINVTTAPLGLNPFCDRCSQGDALGWHTAAPSGLTALSQRGGPVASVRRSLRRQRSQWWPFLSVSHNVAVLCQPRPPAWVVAAPSHVQPQRGGPKTVAVKSGWAADRPPSIREPILTRFCVCCTPPRVMPGRRALDHGGIKDDRRNAIWRISL